MSDPLVLCEQRGHVRVLRLNRPEKKNALSDALGWAIVAAFEEAAADDDVWVVGLTGAGDAFCSGLDLSPSSGDASPLSPQNAALDELSWVGRFPVLLRETCDKPVVGGLNGVAVGAGFSLAMATDIKIASASARLLAGYARMGTSPDGGLTWTLAQSVGYEKALRFLLEQRMVGADEALALGLVGEVVPDDDFEARFLAYCDELAKVAPLAARQSKRMLHRATLATDLAAHSGAEIAYARKGLASEDGAEARQAFFDKRAPSFRGR